MFTRRRWIALSVAQALLPSRLVRSAPAQTPKTPFPEKLVRIIVPVAAGGPTDIVARMLADKLSKIWGQEVFIENKGGAGTNIGNEYAARSDPDGYTILFGQAFGGPEPCSSESPFPGANDCTAIFLEWMNFWISTEIDAIHQMSR